MHSCGICAGPREYAWGLSTWWLDSWQVVLYYFLEPHDRFYYNLPGQNGLKSNKWTNNLRVCMMAFSTTTSLITFFRNPHCWGQTEQTSDKWAWLMKFLYSSSWVWALSADPLQWLTFETDRTFTTDAFLKRHLSWLCKKKKKKPDIEDPLIFVCESNCHFCSASVCYHIWTSNHSLG